MVDESEREEPVLQAAHTNDADRPAGDIEMIYREHAQSVLRAAYRVTGNIEDAQDVVQTVFMRLVRRQGGSPLSDSPGHYLHRAAVNAALDVVRSRRSRRASNLEDVEPVLAGDATEAPDRMQDGDEIRRKVREALATISPKHAEIFVLRYFEGYGNHEIAEMLGTSRSTVNVILHRTRQKLQDELGPYVGEGR
jgi:RNA polymerase sigma-70 factor (ECF subfamily)